MISEAARTAQKASQAIDSTHYPPSLQDRLGYKRFMDCDEAPVRVSPTLELEWVAFKLLRGGQVDYSKAPSKAAASWLRKLRLVGSKPLRDKFWEQSWPGYMDSRLSLELRAAAPPSVKGRAGAKANGRGGSLNGDEAIDRLLKKNEGS